MKVINEKVQRALPLLVLNPAAHPAAKTVPTLPQTRFWEEIDRVRRVLSGDKKVLIFGSVSYPTVLISGHTVVKWMIRPPSFSNVDTVSAFYISISEQDPRNRK